MAILLVNIGRAIISLALSQATTPPKYVGWGTGAAAIAAGATDVSTPVLVNMTGGSTDRTLGVMTQQTVNSTNDTYQVVATRTATAAGTITQLSLTDAASGGNLCVGVDSQSVALANGDSIQATFKLTFS